MRNAWLPLILWLTAVSSPGQQHAAPQTARQALLEIFMSQTPGALEKHLPESARRVLVHGGAGRENSVLQEFSSMRGQLLREGNEVQVFDDGPMLLVEEDKSDHERTEVLVEGDDLSSDEDTIEVSFHVYRDGQVVDLPVIPRVTFSMRLEDDIWRLNELTVALHVPLNDPEYLNGWRKRQDETAEARVVGAVRTVNTAEISYAAMYPERGFTCKLSELGGTNVAKEPSPDHAMLIDSSLAGGVWKGYVVTVTGCGAAPAAKYQVTAVPQDGSSGRHSFCSDETGVVRSAGDGTAASCLQTGAPIE